MKKTLISTALLSILMSSCSWRRIADLNMVSNRNIDTKSEYVELRTYVTAKVTLKKDNSLDKAIDEVVKGVPGGEYLHNVKISIKGDRRLKIEGDVWGIDGKDIRLKYKQYDKLEKKQQGNTFQKKMKAIEADSIK